MCSSRQPGPRLARSSGSCVAAMHARRLGRFPDARTERAAETGDAHAGDLDNPGVQRALRGARVAVGLDQVRPHLGAAVVVVVAEDPVHVDAAIQQRRRQVVERPLALDVAQQDRGLRQRIERRQAAFDAVPLLVDVADEDDRHGFVRSVPSGLTLTMSRRRP